MTAAKLTSNKFLSYIIYKIKTQKTLCIISTVFSFLAYPVPVLIASITSHSTGELGLSNVTANIFPAVRTAIETAVIFAVISMAVLLVLGYVIAVNSFRSTYDKTIVDVHYSLPLTQGQRFWGDFLGGLLIYTVPNMVCALIAAIIYPTVKFSTIEISMGEPDITKLSTMFGAFLTVFILYIMVYCFTVMVVNCTGQLLEAILFPGTVMVSIFVILIGIYSLLDSGNIEQYILIAISALLSPVGFVYTVILCLQSYPQQMFAVFHPYLLLCALVQLAVCITAAYFIAVRRKAEHTGKPFLNNIAYYVMSTLIILAIVLGFNMVTSSAYMFNDYGFDNEALISVIVITAVLFLFLELMRNRGFKKILRSVIDYAAVMVFSFLFGLAVDNIDIKSEWIVPDAGNVTSIAVRFNSLSEIGMYDDIVFTEPEDIEYLTAVDRYGMLSSKIQDPESFELVRNSEEYKRCLEILGIEDRDFNLNNYYEYETFRDFSNSHGTGLNYELKNGLYVRHYVSERDLEPLVSLLTSETVRQHKIDVMKKDLDSDFANSLKLTYTNFPGGERLTFTDEEARKFAEAYLADIEAESDESILNGSKLVGIGVMNIYYVANDNIPDPVNLNYNYDAWRLIIKESYSNTIDLLKSCGVSMEQDFSKVKRASIKMVNPFFEFSYAGTGSSYDIAECEYYLDLSDPDVIELLEHAKTFTAKSYSHRFIVNLEETYTLYIPEEYNSLAEKVYLKCIDNDKITSLEDAVICDYQYQEWFECSGLEYYVLNNCVYEQELLVFGFRDYFNEMSENYYKIMHEADSYINYDGPFNVSNSHSGVYLTLYSENGQIDYGNVFYWNTKRKEFIAITENGGVITINDFIEQFNDLFEQSHDQ